MRSARFGSSRVRVFWTVAVLALWALPAAVSSARAQVENPGGGAVSVRAVFQKSVVHPGDPVALAVVMDHQTGFHSWPAQDVLPPEVASFAIRTQIGVALPLPAWVEKFDGVQYPEPHPAKVANPSGAGTIDAPLYSGRAIGYVRIVIAPNAPPGVQTITVTVSYQACNDKVCQMPEDVALPVSVEVAPQGSGKVGVANEPELFAGLDVTLSQPSAASAKPATGGKPVEFTFFKWKFRIDPSGPIGFALLLLVAMLGGFVLNLTPCVLPVIPIKILSLSKGAGNPRRCLFLGIIMSIGVVAFWLTIGTGIAFIAGFKTTSALFQIPWIPLAIGIFMFLMGLGMFGVFTIRLPNAVYMINPRGDTASGSFVFGIMTAVLSTPCLAPFMGAAAAWAAFQVPTVTIATFFAIGLGMALPYLVLAANPKWVDKVPRTGPASELVKQVMGIFMFAVAAFFVGPPIAAWLNRPPDPVARGYWWIIGGLVAVGALWMAYRTARITRSTVKRIVFGGGGVVLAAVAVFIASIFSSHGPIKWEYYTPDRFAQAKAKGEVIVMDFTAEWCLNCKALESSVLHRPEIVKVLNSDPRVKPMKVDITGNNIDGKAKLKELNWVGIPLLAVFGPGVGYDTPVLMDSYTPQMVEDAIEKARGGGLAQRAP